MRYEVNYYEGKLMDMTYRNLTSN